MAKDKLYKKKIKFDQNQLNYTLQIRKSYWKWLWLLLLLLLFVRCERDITVVVTDKKTHQPIPAVPITLNYTAHFLFKDGRPFANIPHHYEAKTDAEGQAEFKGLECSVYSYIFYCLSRVTATADVVNTKTENFHTTRYIYFELSDLECDIDIVMCIDNTASMDGLIDMVKDNALRFYKDLKTSAVRHKRNIQQMRVQVISFGDLKEKPIVKSRFFDVSTESGELASFVKSIYADGGGDDDESTLEALAMAIDNDWVVSDNARRHIIIIYTNAGAHKLENPSTKTSHYPAGMPANLDELQQRWNAMDPECRRLIIYAPKYYPWGKIRKWDDVNLFDENLNNVISGGAYDKIIEDLLKTL